MSWIVIIRPLTIHFSFEGMRIILHRVKQKTPLWEKHTILNVANAIHSEAESIRSTYFFSGQQTEPTLMNFESTIQSEILSVNKRSKEVDTQLIVSVLYSLLYVCMCDYVCLCCICMQAAKHVWHKSSLTIEKPVTHKTQTSLFIDAEKNLRNIENDVLSDMMAPSNASLTAPKPMYNQGNNNNFPAKKTQPKRSLPPDPEKKMEKKVDNNINRDSIDLSTNPFFQNRFMVNANAPKTIPDYEVNFSDNSGGSSSTNDDAGQVLISQDVQQQAQYTKSTRNVLDKIADTVVVPPPQHLYSLAHIHNINQLTPTTPDGDQVVPPPAHQYSLAHIHGINQPPPTIGDEDEELEAAGGKVPPPAHHYSLAHIHDINQPPPTVGDEELEMAAGNVLPPPAHQYPLAHIHDINQPPPTIGNEDEDLKASEVEINETIKASSIDDRYSIDLFSIPVMDEQQLAAASFVSLSFC